MSKNNEKDSSSNIENECLLCESGDLSKSSSLEVPAAEMAERCPRNGEPAMDVPSVTVCPASGGLTDSSSQATASGSNSATPSATVVDVDENLADDDPPPYTAVAPPNHRGWTFDFPSSIAYSIHHARAPCRAALAPFQTPLGSTAVRFDPGNSIGQGALIPGTLTFYNVDKFGSDGTPFLYRNVPLTECEPVAKDTGRKICRYRAILAAAAVIVLLMTLSLLVRFIVEKSFSWR